MCHQFHTRRDVDKRIVREPVESDLRRLPGVLRHLQLPARSGIVAVVAVAVHVFLATFIAPAVFVSVVNKCLKLNENNKLMEVG